MEPKDIKKIKDSNPKIVVSPTLLSDGEAHRLAKQIAAFLYEYSTDLATGQLDVAVDEETGEELPVTGLMNKRELCAHFNISVITFNKLKDKYDDLDKAWEDYLGQIDSDIMDHAANGASRGNLAMMNFWKSHYSKEKREEERLRKNIALEATKEFAQAVENKTANPAKLRSIMVKMYTSLTSYYVYTGKMNLLHQATEVLDRLTHMSDAPDVDESAVDIMDLQSLNKIAQEVYTQIGGGSTNTDVEQALLEGMADSEAYANILPNDKKLKAKAKALKNANK